MSSYYHQVLLRSSLPILKAARNSLLRIPRHGKCYGRATMKFIQSAIQANNGYVFQIIGDAFCAAFHTAHNGLRAALEAQQNIQKEDWGRIPDLCPHGTTFWPCRAARY